MFRSNRAQRASTGLNKPNQDLPQTRDLSRTLILVLFAAGMFSGIVAVDLWQKQEYTNLGQPLTAEAQSKKKKSVKWNFTMAGTVPTEFGELITVNGTSGNYTLVFQDTEKKVRLVDLRGGKIPSRAILFDRK